MATNMKNIVINVVVIAAIAILIFFLVQSITAHRWGAKYEAANKKFGELQQEYDNFKATAEKEKAQLRADRDKDKQEREELDASIAKLENEKIDLEIRLAREKKKTATLSPDDLAKKLNKRVPNEYSLLQTNDFRLTRVGGEKTLNLFLDGESYLEKYNNQLKISQADEKKIGSLEESLAKAEKETSITEEELKKCDDSLKACVEAKTALEKSVRSRKWKARFQGALGGSALTVALLKIFGAI